MCSDGCHALLMQKWVIHSAGSWSAHNLWESRHNCRKEQSQVMKAVLGQRTNCYGSTKKESVPRSPHCQSNFTRIIKSVLVYLFCKLMLPSFCHLILYWPFCYSFVLWIYIYRFFHSCTLSPCWWGRWFSFPLYFPKHL